MISSNGEHRRSPMNYPTCYVCGAPNIANDYLNVKQNLAKPSEPYFPFLDSHKAPENSLPISNNKVISCNLCKLLLLNQWQKQEDRNEDQSKRIYWFKRVDGHPYSGVVSGIQSEYASQLFGLAHEATNINDDRPPLSASPANIPSRAIQASPSVAPPSSRPASVTSTVPLVSPLRAAFTPSQSHPDAPLHPYVQSRFPSPRSRPLAVGVSSGSHVASVPQEEALDLTVVSKRLHVPEKQISEQKKFKTTTCADETVLDLSMPDQNSSTVVCYVCGQHYSRGSMSLIMIYTVEGVHSSQPFFPSLMDNARPSKSHPVQSTGSVQGCNACYAVLCLEWRFFNMKAIEHNLRDYYSGKPYTKLEPDSVICCECNLFSSFNEANVIFSANSEKSYLSDSERKRNALTKMARIICNCCKAKKLADDCSETSNEIDICDTSSPEAKPETHSVLPGNTNGLDLSKQLTSSTCYLCLRSYALNTMNYINTRPNTLGTDMYFPSLLRLRQVDACVVTEDGRVLTCPNCFDNLQKQWNEFEALNIPIDKRNYTLNIPPALPSSISSSRPNEPVLKEPDFNGGIPIRSLEVQMLPPVDAINLLPPLVTQNPLRIPAHCYLCGYTSEPGKTYVLCSRRQSYSEMFFPFLEKYQSPCDNSSLGESNFLACTFCFHSLVQQWQEQEKANVDADQRVYGVQDFICYICGIKTYRTRLHKLRVELFPFLKNHAKPPSALTIDWGQAVTTCTDCHTRLTAQFTDMERCGVPIDKRDYNWKKIPAPPITADTIASTAVAEGAPLVPQSQSLDAPYALDKPLTH